MTRAYAGLDESALHAEAARRWDATRGWRGALSTLDHKTIGARYIVTALAFLCLAGAAAVAMRLQLARPQSRLLSADMYNELFTMHGTTMMFLFAVPVMQGVEIGRAHV